MGFRGLPRLLLVLALVGPVPLAGQALLPEALVLSPEPGERVASRDVLLAVSFIDPANRLDSASVTLLVGGVDVTSEAVLSGGVLTWRPRQPLPPGPHRAVVTATDRTSGVSLAPANWTFNVTALADGATIAPGAPQAPTRSGWAGVHGSIIVEGTGQTITGVGAPLRRTADDFLPRMWLNAGGVIRPGWRYSTRIHVSGYEAANLQPVNRYRFDLRTPMLSLSGGDVTPVFQSLILSGRRVRGVQGELGLGPLHLSVVSGQTRRAIEGVLDPTGLGVARLGTYGQNLFAVRPAIGSGNRFQAGLTMMRVRDEVGSLALLRTTPSASGGSLPATPAPKDNLVAGLDLTLRVAQGRLLLQYENGVSLLANDISSGPLTEEEFDTVLEGAGIEPAGIDPARFERFFIVNASMLPLDPRGLTNVAHQARASVRAGSHFVSGGWTSVGGAYHTLGYQSLRRDRAGFWLRDSFTAMNDQLVVTAGVERDEDNLNGVKLATTTTSAGYANVHWQVAPRSLMLSGSVRLGNRSNELSSNAFGALDEQTRALSGAVSVPLSLMSGMHTRVSLNLAMIDREDASNLRSGSKDFYYLAGLHGETDQRTSAFALLGGLNQSELTGFSARTDIYRVTGSARHQFVERWTGLLDGTYIAARSPEDALAMGLQYDRAEFLVGGEFEWMPTAVLSFTTGVISYNDERFVGRDTRELVARVRLSRTF